MSSVSCALSQQQNQLAVVYEGCRRAVKIQYSASYRITLHLIFAQGRAERDSALQTCLRVAIPPWPWGRACASRLRPGDVPARRDSTLGTCLPVAFHEGPSRSTRACGSDAPAAAQRRRRVRLSSWDSSAGARRAGARPMHAQRTQRKPYTRAMGGSRALDPLSAPINAGHRGSPGCGNWA